MGFNGGLQVLYTYLSPRVIGVRTGAMFDCHNISERCRPFRRGNQDFVRDCAVRRTQERQNGMQLPERIDRETRRSFSKLLYKNHKK
jgi:hypothetical protein